MRPNAIRRGIRGWKREQQSLLHMRPTSVRALVMTFAGSSRIHKTQNRRWNSPTLSQRNYWLCALHGCHHPFPRHDWQAHFARLPLAGREADETFLGIISAPEAARIIYSLVYICQSCRDNIKKWPKLGVTHCTESIRRVQTSAKAVQVKYVSNCEIYKHVIVRFNVVLDILETIFTANHLTGAKPDPDTQTIGLVRLVCQAADTRSRNRRYKFDARFRCQFFVPMHDF